VIVSAELAALPIAPLSRRRGSTGSTGAARTEASRAAPAGNPVSAVAGRCCWPRNNTTRRIGHQTRPRR